MRRGWKGIRGGRQRLELVVPWHTRQSRVLCATSFVYPFHLCVSMLLTLLLMKSYAVSEARMGWGAKGREWGLEE